MATSFPNEAFFTAIQAGLVAHAEGLPGVAKTETIKAFARATKRKCYILIGSLREPADIGGYPFPVDHQVVASEEVTEGGKKIGHIALLAPKWAADTWDGEKWLIVFDEITTCPPAVQAAMLRVLAERIVGDTPLPADTWLCALSNPSGIAANGFELEPPMANRMVHFKWETDWEAWEQGISSGGEFPEPRFRAVPEEWHTRKAYWGSLVAAFRKHKSDCFYLPTDSAGNVTVERSKLSGAWASPRSWWMAVQGMAACDSAKSSESVRSMVLHGAVGFDVAHQFETWLANLDLPDAEEVLKAAIACMKDNTPVPMPAVDRPDKVIAFLATLTERVVGNPNDTERFTGERWNAAIEIVERIGSKYADVALSQLKPLVSNLPPGAKFSTNFQKNLYPILFRALAKTR
jgi:hypothetical protein